MSTGAEIVEIFSSIQGEGFLAGRRQIFIRFARCNLRCIYCDTRYSWKPHNFCRVEKEAGSREFYEIKNPVDVDTLIKIVERLKTCDMHSISLTGGEPLLHADFIKKLPLKNLYLETNGSLPEEAEKISEKIKYASVDIKLKEHGVSEDIYIKELKTIDILRKKAETFAKLVVLKGTEQKDVEKVAQDLASIGNIDLVLQPVTAEEVPNFRYLLKLSEIAGKYLNNVIILPQIHKLYKGWL